MKTSVGATLSQLRKEKKLKQNELAAILSGYGFKVGAKTIYNWEKGLAHPGIPHFLALCDILDVDDVLWQFAGIPKGPYAGLNSDGRKKAREFIDLLFHIDMYKTGSTDQPALHTAPDAPGVSVTSVTSGVPAASSSYDIPKHRSSVTHIDSQISHRETKPPRILRLYDIPVSAGSGNFLDDSGYEEIEAPSYVPVAVDFALRVSGDSMNPLIRDGQVIWVKEQEVLENGEIGIFSYSGDVYCKKLIADGSRAYLRSLNPAYNDIEILDDYGFKVIGKVV